MFLYVIIFFPVRWEEEKREPDTRSAVIVLLWPFFVHIKSSDPWQGTRIIPKDHPVIQRLTHVTLERDDENHLWFLARYLFVSTPNVLTQIICNKIRYFFTRAWNKFVVKVPRSRYVLFYTRIQSNHSGLFYISSYEMSVLLNMV